MFVASKSHVGDAFERRHQRGLPISTRWPQAENLISSKSGPHYIRYPTSIPGRGDFSVGPIVTLTVGRSPPVYSDQGTSLDRPSMLGWCQSAKSEGSKICRCFPGCTVRRRATWQEPSEVSSKLSHAKQRNSPLGTGPGSQFDPPIIAGLGTSSMYLQGETEAALTALNRGVAIAEERNDALSQVGLLALLLMFQFRRADFKTTLLCARRGRAVAKTVEDPAAIALAHSMLGRSLHVTGDLNGARAELEASQPASQVTRPALLDPFCPRFPLYE